MNVYSGSMLSALIPTHLHKPLLSLSAILEEENSDLSVLHDNNIKKNYVSNQTRPIRYSGAR